MRDQSKKKKSPSVKPEPEVQRPNFVVTDNEHDTTVNDDGEPQTFHTEQAAIAAAKECAPKYPREVFRVYQLIVEIHCDVGDPVVSHVTTPLMRPAQ